MSVRPLRRRNWTARLIVTRHCSSNQHPICFFFVAMLSLRSRACDATVLRSWSRVEPSAKNCFHTRAVIIGPPFTVPFMSWSEFQVEASRNVSLELVTFRHFPTLNLQETNVCRDTFRCSSNKSLRTIMSTLILRRRALLAASGGGHHALLVSVNLP